MPMIQNITNVRGIKCWGAHSGVKSMRRDIALIYSETLSNAAAVFTQNNVVAEPVKLSKQHIKDGKAQAFVINAGNANACTGEDGFKAAEAMAKKTASELNIETTHVIVSSTGLIGEPFPTDDVINGIAECAEKLNNDTKAGTFTANAILTTDTFAKEGFLEFDIDGKDVRMGGIAKGSGMIHPNMATMLGFIVTDIAITSHLLDKALRKAVDRSFNMITVDGDTSTNDMVAIMANGMVGNEIIESENDPNFKIFYDKLEEMCMHLAKLIVSDGEGASKFIEYRVVNAPDELTARKIIREISDSTLVKTAMFGRDPNWGRIIAAAGNAGVEFDYLKADLYLGSQEQMVQVLEKGKPVELNRNQMKKLLRESHINVKLDMNNGESTSIGWGSDLTTDYVMFNSVYTT